MAALLCTPATLAGQASERAGDPWFTPTAFLGASGYFAEPGEDGASTAGVGVRAGLRLPYADVTAGVAYWGDVSNFRISSIHMEASYFFAGEQTVSPLVVVGLGYAWTRYHGQFPGGVDRREFNGLSAAYGFGVQWPRWHALGLRTEAVIRTDAGGYSGEIRGLLGWAPDAPGLPAGLPAARTEIGAYWMVPLSGPWRFVEPGYVVRFERPYHERWSGSLALGVFHWQIPGRAFLRNYIVDTRAFMATPAVQWHPRGQRWLSLRAGPSFIVMGEGPGNGVSVGTHLETALSRPWDLPLSIGVGWLWMVRDETVDSRVSAADQNGLMLFGGLHF